MEQQIYIENQCKWRDDTRFRRQWREWSAWRVANEASEASGVARMKRLKYLGCQERPIWSDANKVENIQLFRWHRASTSSRRHHFPHVQFFTVAQSNDVGEVNCSCVWAPGACTTPQLTSDRWTGAPQLRWSACSWCPGRRSWPRPELTGLELGSGQSEALLEPVVI